MTCFRKTAPTHAPVPCRRGSSERHELHLHLASRPRRKLQPSHCLTCVGSPVAGELDHRGTSHGRDQLSPLRTRVSSVPALRARQRVLCGDFRCGLQDWRTNDPLIGLARRLLLYAPMEEGDSAAQANSIQRSVLLRVVFAGEIGLDLAGRRFRRERTTDELHVILKSQAVGALGCNRCRAAIEADREVNRVGDPAL